MKKWEITSWSNPSTKTLDEYLEDGWEPYAVTEVSYEDRDGYSSTELTHWLRREV